MGLTNQIGASSIIKPGVIDNTAARPASPYEGQVIFQKDTDQLLVWNGTAWVIPNSPAQNPMGLELIKTQTIGTAVGSVTVTNVFSSTYDRYLITLGGGTSSATTGAIKLQLGPTSVSGYNTEYYGYLVYGTYATGGVNAATHNNQSTWNWVGGTAGTGGATIQTELTNPFLSLWTRMYTPAYEGTGNSGFQGGIHKSTNSFTDFVITPESGTLTGGTIRVYGYRNAI